MKRSIHSGSARLFALGCLFLALLTPLTASADEDDAKLDPKVKTLLQETIGFHRGLQRLRVEMVTDIRMEGTGFKNQMTNVYSVRFKRPRQFALELESGQNGSTVICDGTKIITYVPLMKQYTESEASGDLGELVSSVPTDIGGGMGMDPLIVVIPPDDAYEQMMEGVTATKYAGIETQGDVQCHVLKFYQDDFNWEVCVRTGASRLLERMVFDMGNMMEQDVSSDAESAAFFKDMKMKMSITFRNWDLDAELSDKDFQFALPEGAEKVESFFAGLADADQEDEVHPLLGKEAPNFTLKRIGGETVELAQHKGKDVVILDFWATWCGPCTQALPAIAKVAAEYKEKGVVFYAVNLQEDEEKVRRFLEEKKLDVETLLDLEGDVGEEYHAEAIPQTVLVGRDGSVQVVHVGLLPNLEKQLTGELDALLQGEDLAAKTIAEAEEKTEEKAREKAAGTEAVNLEEIWSDQGRWTAIAVDTSKNVVYVASPRGVCVQLDDKGQRQKELTLNTRATVLRAANLAGDESREILSFASWGRSVKAHDAEGHLLWEHALGQGVDDVASCDLNGDGLDEVIIGYNGSTGLYVLDNRGEVLWNDATIGNVWHVCGGDVDGDGEPEVVTTSAAGDVHVFSADGENRRDIETSCYANMVRLAPPDEALARLIIVGGTSAEGGVLEAIDTAGKTHWTFGLTGGADSHIDSAATADGRPWIAVGLRGGAVTVVDLISGAQIARVNGQGRTPHVAWLRPAKDGPPVLLVTTGKRLAAFRVVEGSEGAATGK